MEEGIQRELDNGTAADPEFMSAVLKRLVLHKAKARLKEIHQGLMAKHAERIIATQDPSMDVRKAMGWQIDEVGLADPGCLIQKISGAPWVPAVVSTAQLLSKFAFCACHDIAEHLLAAMHSAQCRTISGHFRQRQLAALSPS